MTNKKHIGKYLIAIFACMCFTASCTYDYFEDETNYIVYVPKVNVNERTDTYKVDDLRILIYNTSSFERERYSSYPFEDNARTRVGDFNFKIFPGLHNVYCFSNISNVGFWDIESYDAARFELDQIEDGLYKEPPVILLNKLTPDIIFPGPIVRDTALMDKKYVGQICIAFKNLTTLSPSLIYNNIKKVEVLARGVGVTQPLTQIRSDENTWAKDSTHTRSSRKNAADKMFLTSTLYQNPYLDYEFGFDNYYFPSPKLEGAEENEPISLQITFKDGNDNILYNPLIIDLLDKNSQKMILHMNEILMVTIDGNDINIFSLTDPKDWNPNIDQGGDLDL